MSSCCSEKKIPETRSFFCCWSTKLEVLSEIVILFFLGCFKELKLLGLVVLFKFVKGEKEAGDRQL